jgi:hypothetical protein
VRSPVLVLHGDNDPLILFADPYSRLACFHPARIWPESSR